MQDGLAKFLYPSREGRLFRYRAGATRQGHFMDHSDATFEFINFSSPMRLFSSRAG